MSIATLVAVCRYGQPSKPTADRRRGPGLNLAYRNARRTSGTTAPRPRQTADPVLLSEYCIEPSWLSPAQTTARERPASRGSRHLEPGFTRFGDRNRTDHDAADGRTRTALPRPDATSRQPCTTMPSHPSHELYAHDRLLSALMAARSAHRSPRPGSHAGAALVVLLAMLVHLLGCAHGPALDSVRTDSLLTMTTSCGPASAGVADEPATQHGTPSEDEPVECEGSDEPSVQPPRDIVTPAPTAALTVQPMTNPAAPHVRRPPLPPAPDPGSPDTGRSRAGLGVWRT